MKFMRLGTKPDTFYTDEATRMVISELPSDLTIHINNITYLQHKFPLLQKCGLLQQLCSESRDTSSVNLELHEIPGGADGFELCAKFCYGIKIDLSAYNFVPAFVAANSLRMTESVGKGNLVSKLEVFFDSCILDGWKDTIFLLQTTERYPEESQNLGIIRRCIDSIVDKILTPTSKVRWSYTYSRPGYAQKKHHKSAPRDWWTEDIADLNIDLFRCVVNTVTSTNMVPPQLIGEALHVYACRWLLNVTSGRSQPKTLTVSQMAQHEESLNRKRQLEVIISLIPEDRGSVSVGFLIRLLSMANVLGVSQVILSLLVKKCSLQLDEATLDDLIILSSLESCSDHHIHNIELVEAILEGFITQWRELYSRDEKSLMLITKVGKLVDSYLQVVSRDENISVQKVVSLAKALPEFARPKHDKLYKAIDIYLNEHLQMSKEDKKHLCRILHYHKMSAEARAHAVKNERLPLRTVVQVLFFEHEKQGGKSTTSHDEIQLDDLKRLHLGLGEESSKGGDGRRSSHPSSSSQMLEPEYKSSGSDKLREIMEEGSIQDHTKLRMQRSKSEHGHRKGK